jgi:GNAT superfamily N-acetyltransferase
MEAGSAGHDAADVDVSVGRSARAAEAAIAWADAEGWNPGLDDGQRFLAADPYSFLAAERDGEIVGTVSCALYGDEYAFIGFYIVRPDLRGRGIGSDLFAHALRRHDVRVRLSRGLSGLERAPTPPTGGAGTVGTDR